MFYYLISDKKYYLKNILLKIKDINLKTIKELLHLRSYWVFWYIM